MKVIIFSLLIFLLSGLCPGCSIWNGDDRGLEKGASRAELGDFLSKIKRPTGNPDSHLLLGTYYQNRGRHIEAIKEFEIVVAIDPARAKAFNAMGVSYDHLGMFSPAIRCYEKALSLDSRLDHVHNNIGYSYLLQGKLHAAETALNRAISMNSDIGIYHNNLGAVYAAMKDYDRAMSEFQKGSADVPAARETAGIHCLEDATATLAAVVQNVPDTAPRDCAGTAERMETPYPKDEPSVIARIELSNGNGRQGMARNVGKYLKQRGYEAFRYTNANHFHFEKNRILFREGSRRTAVQLSDALPGRWILRQVNDSDRKGIRVRVLLGKEMILHKEIIERGLKS